MYSQDVDNNIDPMNAKQARIFGILIFISTILFLILMFLTFRKLGPIEFENWGSSYEFKKFAISYILSILCSYAIAKLIKFEETKNTNL